MSQRTFMKDYEFGKENEIKMLSHIKQLLSDKTIEQHPYEFSVFDFEGENKRVELKSRKCHKWQYPTTILPPNKISNAKKFKGDYYFIFSFTNRNCFIKYDKELFKTFKRGEGGRCDRGCDERRSDYVHIPIDNLTNF